MNEIRILSYSLQLYLLLQWCFLRSRGRVELALYQTDLAYGIKKVLKKTKRKKGGGSCDDDDLWNGHVMVTLHPFPYSTNSMYSKIKFMEIKLFQTFPYLMKMMHDDKDEDVKYLEREK